MRTTELCGVIQMDDVIDIIMHEASEDLAKMGGGGKDIDFDTKPLAAVKRRLPGSSCYYSSDSSQAGTRGLFRGYAESVWLLSHFSCLMIAGMTGNTGTQSLAVVVRGSHWSQA